MYWRNTFVRSGIIRLFSIRLEKEPTMGVVTEEGTAASASTRFDGHMFQSFRSIPTEKPQPLGPIIVQS